MVQFMTRSVDFLKYLQKVGESKFLQFPHCVMSSKKTLSHSIDSHSQANTISGTRRFESQTIYFCFCIQNSSPRGQKFVSKVPISYPEKKKNPNRKEEKTEKNFVKLTYFPRMTNFISSTYVEKRKFCITPQIFRQNQLNVKVEFTEFLTFY